MNFKMLSCGHWRASEHPGLAHLLERINLRVLTPYHSVRGVVSSRAHTEMHTIHVCPETSQFLSVIQARLHSTPCDVRQLMPKLCVPLCYCRWTDTERRWEQERWGGSGLHQADILPCFTRKSAFWRFLGTVSRKTSYFTRACWSWKGNTTHHNYSFKIIRHERTKLSSLTWEVIAPFTIKKNQRAKRTDMFLNLCTQSRPANGTHMPCIKMFKRYKSR